MNQPQYTMKMARVPFNRDLSLKLDETIAMLDLAQPSPFRTMLECRKEALECIIFKTPVHVADCERCDPETWEIIRKAILARDRYTCQGCGTQGKVVNVHHIVMVSAGGNDEPQNLLTLCDGCHQRIHPWLLAKDAA